MKLEVGMYVRLKKGVIERIRGFKPITKYTKYNTLYFENILGECLFTNEELKEFKASHNIIDILEVGDYVNGVEVINIDDEWITMSDTQVPILKSIANGMIKSVITHEQMEQMAYKVVE